MRLGFLVRACRFVKISCGVVLAVLLYPSSILGQQSLTDLPAKAATGPQGAANVLPAEPLGPNDLIEISVAYCPELSRSFRIGAAGELTLPLLHNEMKVTGMRPAELAYQLKNELEQEHILVNPVVSVSVLEYRSRPVSIVGAVNHPSILQATAHLTLLQAIADAGGLTYMAGGQILVTRPSISDTTVMETESVAVTDLMNGSDPHGNLPLRGGEEIRVPEAKKVFVVGNVRHPGMYPMPNDSITVVKAIALSQGLDSFTSHIAYIYRLSKGTNREEIPVPLEKILARKAPDVALAADDVLYVPTSKGRKLTSQILTQIASFGQAAGTGALIYK